MMTNDCIEKRAALDALWGVFCGADEDGKRIVGECFKAVEALPTAQPQMTRGKWIGGELGRCSVCGHEGNASDIWNGCKGMFCPNCGADMMGDNK